MQKRFYRKYVEEIKKLCGYFPAVGIIGPRQVGKTTICKMISELLEKECLYLDLELPSDLNKLGKPELFLSQFHDKCIIIDEIQRKPELFPLLRSLVDKSGESCQYIITGSASPDLLRQSTESLAGRIAYVQIFPFTLDELPDPATQPIHWLRGGYPRSLLAPDDDLANTWITNFVQTYVERDLQLLGLSVEPVLLRRLWTMLAHTHGNILNYTTLASSLDINVKTIKKYIDFFEQTFLAVRIPPFYLNIKKRMVKSPKIYLTDAGILHNLTGISKLEELMGNPILGNSWEGYCLVQIMSKVKSKYEISFYRTLDAAECDFVLSKSGKAIYALEIKYSAAPKLTRGNTLAFQQINAENNIVIVPQNTEAYPLKENIKVLGIKEFLDVIHF